jgi:acetyl/propionyl-CoA carboxylase alpha subunit
MKIQFEFERKQVSVHTQKIGGKIWLHYSGQNFCVDLDETSRSRSKKKKHAGAHSGEILAPMPGKVTKLFKSAGEAVKKGDAVLVMEAMKMEYTLKADSNGTVSDLFCSVGDQVVLGKLLMKIKTEATNG